VLWRYSEFSLFFVILPFKEPSASSPKHQGRNAYWISGTILSGVLAIGSLAFALPHSSGAFWPLSVTNASGTTAPIIQDASLDLLSAPTSVNIDDTIPDSSITSDGSAFVPGVDFDGSTTPNDASTAGDTEIDPTNSSGTISTYTVKPGDTLSQIAENFGVSENTILWANDITDKSTIKPGDKLVILPVSGIQHTVRSGETLSSIAEKYGGNADDIALFNGLADGSALQVGSTIIIPGGELTSSGSKSGSSSASTSSSSTKKSVSVKTTSSPKASVEGSSSGENSSVECDNTSGNPCHGVGGAPLRGFFTNPLPSGAMVSQGLHGWDAVDLAISAGTAIHAAASGTVILSTMGGWNGGYGSYVILDNGSGVETLYAHMSETNATVGDTVSAGQVIGYVGRTGDATGDHLHFEVRGAQNPFAFCTEGMDSDDCFNP
jgi:murein DD-endopeptidase MepM/ murein hydrolase activator NlpD